MKKLPVYKEEKFRSPLNIEREIGLWVDRIGSKNSSEKSLRLRQLGQYGAVYIQKGQGCLLNSKMIKIPINSGDVVLLYPDQASAYYPLESWYQKWIVWNGPDAEKIEKLGYLNKSRQVIHDSFGIFSQAYDPLSKIINSESKIAILERKNIILNMLLGLSKLNERQVRGQNFENDVENVIVFLQENFHLNISISELAEKFNLSHTHLRRLFRSYTGRAPREFITSLRMSKAKELLLQNKQIKDVAAITGYEDIFYFMRVFKAVTGTSPGRWQKDHSMQEF